MTVSAAVRLIPTPPARVERRKTKEEASLLKRSRAFWRSLPDTRPSKRSLKGSTGGLGDVRQCVGSVIEGGIGVNAYQE